MKSFVRFVFVLGIVIVVNALIHFFIVQGYGNDFIDILKKYDSSEIYDFTIKLVKYEALIGFIILTVASGLILFKPKKRNRKR